VPASSPPVNATLRRLRILPEVRTARFPLAAAASLALGVVLPWAGALPWEEGVCGGLAIALLSALGGKLAGLVRLGFELMLLPPAYVLTLTSDREQRLLLLLFLTSLAASAVGKLRERAHHPLARWEAALAAAVPALAGLPVLVAKFGAASALALGLPAAGLLLPAPLRLPGIWGSWALFSPSHPGVLAGWLLAWAALRRKPLPPGVATVVSRWSVPLFALGVSGATLLPFGGLLAFPGWQLSPWAGAGLGLLAALTAFLPHPWAALAWLFGVWLALPLQPIPPDRPGPTLTAAAPVATLPPGVAGTLYTLELSLANAGTLPAGTLVATVEVAGQRVPLRAGRDTAEWALLRHDVASRGAHGLPEDPVFRPSTGAPWAVAGRLRLAVPGGIAPTVRRDPQLPPAVSVAVLQAGPELPPPKRRVAAEQLLGGAGILAAVFSPGFFAHPFAAAPFALLACGRLLLAWPLEPCRILLERHGVDLALASFLLAWALAFRRALARRRWAWPAAGLLFPLALLAPQLSQLMGDEPYHLALAASLASDGDLDVRNNVDPERYPLWVVELAREAQGRFLHSPVLALLLFPGYLLAGRSGMVLGIALCGWLALLALERRAQELGFSSLGRFWALGALLFAYPFLLFATEIWPEMPAVAVVSWQLLWAARGRFLPAAAVAVLATLMKTRLGLLTVPLAGVALLGREKAREKLLVAGLLAVAVGAAALLVAGLWFGNPLDPLGRRALSHLVPRDLGQPLRVVFGLCCDAAYGIAFAAPLWLVGLAGTRRVFRQGGPGERALLFGAGATVAALLAYVEWRGGGSPPFRYLVPLLPAFFLSLLASFHRPQARALGLLAVPPTALVSWIAITRPALLYNIGDGGHWLADRLASRFAADARHFFPSFLRLSPASVLAPAILALAFLGLWVLFGKNPSLRRWLSRQGVGVWLLAACFLLLALRALPDRVVELEDPQVEHRGGTLEPHPGAWSRFLYPNGWQLGNGDGLVVPLHLVGGSGLRLAGWGEGPEGARCTLQARFLPDGPQVSLEVVPGPPGAVPLPHPGPGRWALQLEASCTRKATVVLDRLEVLR